MESKRREKEGSKKRAKGECKRQKKEGRKCVRMHNPATIQQCVRMHNPAVFLSHLHYCQKGSTVQKQSRNKGLPSFMKNSRKKEGSSVHAISQMMEGSIGSANSVRTGSILNVLAFQKTRSQLCLNVISVLLFEDLLCDLFETWGKCLWALYFGQVW